MGQAKNLILHARATPLDELMSSRVGRHEEIEICVRALSQRRSNVFVWGARGVGKTFLLRIVEASLRRMPHILTVNADMLALSGFGRGDSATAFPEAVLLNLCCAIWVEVLGKPYSELRTNLDLRMGDLQWPNELSRKVETIYAQLLARARKSRYEYANSIGFTAVAKGEKSETGWVEQEQPPIFPFEFLEYCGELLRALNAHGKTQVAVLCDEANLLPLKQQQDILSRYVDLFAERSVQFIFVASQRFGEQELPVIPEAFERVLELGGLATDDASELVRLTAARLELDIAPESTLLAAVELKGNPRLMLGALERAADSVSWRAKITPEVMATAVRTLLSNLAERAFG